MYLLSLSNLPPPPPPLQSLRLSNAIPDTDLFYTTERVDSIFHVLSFIVTHPAYMGEAVKALKMSKVPLLGLLDLCGPRDGGGSYQKDLADHIHRSSSGMIVLLVVFLLIQIIALFAFIASMSYPECTDNSDCPLTTYCYSGPLTRTITGYSTGCVSCGFLDATAVLFVVDVDNLIFRAIMTSRDKNFCLDATKVTLDSLETWTLQAAKIAHGLSFFLVTIVAAVWIKHNGMQGLVASSAELPTVLAFFFGLSQWLVSTAVLFSSSWAR